MEKGLINADTKQLDRLMVELKGFEEEVGEATYHALRRTVDHVATQVTRVVPRSYAIKAKDVRATLRKIKPSRTNLQAGVESKGRTLTLAHFPHSPMKPPARRRRRGYDVRVSIKKGPRMVLSTTPRAFVASTGAKSADKVQHNVFRRVGKSRLPIVTIRTLSVPQMITNDGVASQIQEAAVSKLEERLEHEVVRVMLNIGNKVRRG